MAKAKKKATKKQTGVVNIATAAAAAAAAYAAAARDSVLSLAAKIGVEALKACKSQGVKWLKLAA